MTLDTYNFSGNATTFIGLLGLVSTFIILVTAFRRYFNSNLNR
ncbi:MAG: hypothetical protein ACO3CD_04325 [Candidatus Nanopelagicaceae bacterium]